MILVNVQGAMQLNAPAAAAWTRLRNAVAAQHGVNLNITSPAGAYRSPEMVLDMWLSSPARRQAVYGVPIGGSVARPRSLGGPGSVHENGNCIDIGNWRILPHRTLVEMAREQGFILTIPTEGWHFEYRGGGGGGGFTPPIDEEDDDMKIITTDGGTTSEVSWLIGNQFIHRSGSAETTLNYTNLYGTNKHPLDEPGFQQTCWAHGVSPVTARKLKGGQAWSAERGIFEPGDSYKA